MRFLRALAYAASGIVYALRTERHLRFHLFAAFAAISLGILFALPALQWMVLITTIAAVISAELANTAIESVVNLVSPDYHQLAKTAKDCAAAAVLIVSVAALIIGFLLFGPYIANLPSPKYYLLSLFA